MGGEGRQIALTDSTTMGLGLVYSGLNLRPGDEILQTTHDHYSTDLSLAYRAERTGAKLRRISLYEDPATISEDSIVSNLRKGISDSTQGGCGDVGALVNGREVADTRHGRCDWRDQSKSALRKTRFYFVSMASMVSA